MSSKITICNLSLAMLGADSIVSFDETNKRSRMCDVFYESQVKYLLRIFDWSFARKFSWLNELVLNEDTKPNEYIYQLPYDCARPIDVWPDGHRQKWKIMGNKLYTTLEKVGLTYISNDIPTEYFTDDFIDVLSHRLAIKLCPSITQDTDLLRSLNASYDYIEAKAMESDANIGCSYLRYDNNPNNDTYVDPDIQFDTEAEVAK